MLKQSAVRAVQCPFQLNTLWWCPWECTQKSFYPPGLTSASFASGTFLSEGHILCRSQKTACGTVLTLWYAFYHLLASNCSPHIPHSAILQLSIPTDTIPISISTRLFLQICSPLKQNKCYTLGKIWGPLDKDLGNPSVPCPAHWEPQVQSLKLPRQFYQLCSKEHSQIHID